ncbi:MAG TPA: NAD-dependent epimerase/dehydratase family protein [Candidatus Kapabacteria bacterium]|jgi:UDP-glucose 4-epimerase|nr:NAD-dependent epimerase/dehydratase family protein [Candidatus Kapabacteria bacterium]HOV92498.1 NAD-dependent epimerase/dehydratase family protein [Candidatus Kapabacteria bacterium]
MKICITGGAGFIGSNIAEHYLKLGHEVVIIDNLALGFRKNIPDGAKFYHLDITDNSIAEVFEREKFDVVNHHAALMSVRYSVYNPVDDARTNILGSINLLEAAKNTGVKKFIFSSSAGTVYGEQNVFPCDETHPNKPISPYGVSKLSTEKYIEYYNTLFNLDYVIFRYTNVYGRRQNPLGEAGVIAIFALKMLNNQPVFITGDGSITRDYVYIDDVTWANELALNDNVHGIFNIATGIETDLNTIFDKLATLTNYKQPKVYTAPKLGEQKRSVCTAEKFHKLTGWHPRTMLDEGLPKTVEFYKSYNI